MSNKLKDIKNHLSPLKQLLPQRRSPLKIEDLDPAPFFIIGSGRCGTTLLRRVLIQNPAVHIPPETYVLGRLIKSFERNAGLPWNDLVYLSLATFEYHKEFYTFHLENLSSLAQSLKKVPKEKRSLSHIIDSFYHFHAKNQRINCGIWGDKTPLNTLSLNEINKVFPTANYIFLVRDPYDVAYSYVNSGLISTYGKAFNRWVDYNEKGLAFQKKNPNKVLLVKYEHMVSRPDQIIPEIFTFLELEFKLKYLTSSNHKNMGDVEALPHHYNIHNKISSSSIGKGKKHIPKSEQIRMKGTIEKISSKLGY